MQRMTADSDAQFGPHRFYAGEGEGSTELRGARIEAADLRGVRFTDCDLAGAEVRDGWLVDVRLSGYVANLTVNGVDVTGFVDAELDRLHPERVQLREAQSADDVRALWSVIEGLWTRAVERVDRLPAGAAEQSVRDEWSFAQTLRHLVFITDAWASRTVLDEERPYHPLGLPQSWYPAAAAEALGIDLAARPSYEEVLAARADRIAVMRKIVADLTDEGLGQVCPRSPAPGYPDEKRTVIDCVGVVLEEEIEHHRYAVRDLSLLDERPAR